MSSTTSLHCAGIDPLSEILYDFWRQEELPTKRILALDKEEYEKHFVDTFKRDRDCRYVVKLPFKDNGVTELGDSYSKAVTMLKKLGKDFNSKPKFKKLYYDFMEDYSFRGHIIPVILESPIV